jgi:hypothetical protein
MRDRAIHLTHACRAAALGAMLLLALFAQQRAAAWFPEGHMVTGDLAYDLLERQDPQAIATVTRLMQAHPEWAAFDSQLGALTGRARDRRLFELMAVWPDVVRRGPYDHETWHYSQKVVSIIQVLLPFSFGNAQSAFHHNLVIARDPQAAASDRAIALCWVIHIVGDMHQPLHAALWMSGRFPLTDAGGNWAWVRRTPDAAPERLHRIWDSAGRPDGLNRASPDALAAELEREYGPDAEPLSPDPDTAFTRWVIQSRVLAYEVVYRRWGLDAGASQATATVLPDGYIEQVQAVSRDQLAAAGNRIGALLSGLR